MTREQKRAISTLRREIKRLDRRLVKGGVKRDFKTWTVRVTRTGKVEVDSCVGYAKHPFDDIHRHVIIEKDGSMSGFGNIGHGKAGDTRLYRGPDLLYRMDDERIY